MVKEGSKKDLLLEIGCEELPAGYIPPALDAIRREIIDSLKANMISMGDIKTYGTPRRLILWVEGVSSRQRDTTILGPPKHIAYGKDGKPTEALLSFLRSKGVSLADIEKEATKDRVSIVKKGSPTIRLLPEIMPQLIRRIQFPKQMRWEGPDLRFARPIRWLLCLYGARPVAFGLGNLKSGRLTYGHRDLGTRPIGVGDVKTYFKVLTRGKVCFDQEKRKVRLEGELKKLARRVGASGELDKNLLDEVNYMVEYPRVFFGSFDRSYLALPDEVLIASMSKYQRVFALRDMRGKLIPKFLGVADTVKGDIKTIRRNYENILDARLKDSLFFYNEDMKLPMADRVDLLKDLIFMEGLGTLYDKMERVKLLNNFIAERLKLDEANKKKLFDVARLGKVDLTTHMVGEFPSLEGTMGEEYAKAERLDRAVAVGIHEHYLPKSLGGRLPRTNLGVISSISDKLDTIVGCFIKGKKPSASFDPYGLRRRAGGIIQIVVAKKIEFSLKELIDKSMRNFSEQFGPHPSRDELSQELKRFFNERFVAGIAEKFRYDIIDAVCQVEFDRIYDTYKRIKDLSGISKTRGFEEARTVVERTHNILREADFDVGDVDPELFLEPLEERLWKLYKDNQPSIKRDIANKSYVEATRKYGEVFFRPIHSFFDKVLVNVPDKGLRHNRMALMKAINRLYTSEVADLSRIVVERRGKGP